MSVVAFDAHFCHDHRTELGRWIVAAAVVSLAHAGILIGYLYVAPADGITGQDTPPLLIDFAPAAAAPESEADLAPGPESMDAQASEAHQVEQQTQTEPVPDLPPTPAPEPEVVLPQKREVIDPPKEEPSLRPPEPAPEQARKSIQSVKQPTSNPKTEKLAEKPVAPRAGTIAARNASANYATLVSMHLQRFKRPAAGSGTAVISFTVNRAGKVVARSLRRSSGSSAVDAEALALIERAQPLPPFPAAMAESQMSFVQAIRFR